MTADRGEQSWIGALQRGDEDAAQQLWEDYFLKLVGVARKKLQSLPSRAADASGVVQSALNSFFQAARRDAFPQLNDRESLWRLLVVITARKAAHAVRDEFRQKRGGGKVRGESVLDGGNSEFNGLENVLDKSPTPEFVAEFTEELDRRLQLLEDESLRSVAIQKLHGYSNQQIALELDCAERTIERKLKSIRAIWSSES